MNGGGATSAACHRTAAPSPLIGQRRHEVSADRPLAEQRA
jgi:hypothetical protein